MHLTHRMATPRGLEFDDDVFHAIVAASLFTASHLMG